jgi:hypothetical protein
MCRYAVGAAGRASTGSFRINGERRSSAFKAGQGDKKAEIGRRNAGSKDRSADSPEYASPAILSNGAGEQTGAGENSSRRAETARVNLVTP